MLASPYAQADTPFTKECIYHVIDDDRSIPQLEDPAVRHVNTIECTMPVLVSTLVNKI